MIVVFGWKNLSTCSDTFEFYVPCLKVCFPISFRVVSFYRLFRCLAQQIGEKQGKNYTVGEQNQKEVQTDHLGGQTRPELTKQSALNKKYNILQTNTIVNFYSTIFRPTTWSSQIFGSEILTPRWWWALGTHSTRAALWRRRPVSCGLLRVSKTEKTWEKLEDVWKQTEDLQKSWKNDVFFLEITKQVKFGAWCWLLKVAFGLEYLHGKGQWF